MKHIRGCQYQKFLDTTRPKFQMNIAKIQYFFLTFTLDLIFSKVCIMYYSLCFIFVCNCVSVLFYYIK